MNDYSAVAPPQNFSQSSAFAAALQRAKQIAAKINPSGAIQDSKKRSLEDSTEPDAKRLSSLHGNSGGSDSSKDSSSDRGRNSPRDAVNRAKELVQSIINQKIKPDGDSGGKGGSGFVEIMIPGPKVGLIIGKGGETIKQLQEKSGAKMVIIQEGPGQETEKPLRITGDPQKVDHAKAMVYELIAEKEMQIFSRGGRNSTGSNNFSGNNFSGNNAGGESVEVPVPKNAVGVVIGKGGEMIKKLQQEFGCKVQFIQLNEDTPGDRKCLLSGKQPNVDQARQRILELIESVTRQSEYGGWDRNRNNNDGKIEFSYVVPTNKCGIIIGKGGETIKQINQMTGAHCELDRKNPGSETEKYFVIRGTPEQVEHAKRVFSEKLGGMPGNMYPGQPMGYNTTWNPSAGYQAWPGQPTDMNAANQTPQINPQTGQADYSAQWAEYYRSLGMHREAEMIEQQAKQQQLKPDMNSQANPAGGGAVPAQQQMQQQQQQQQQQPQQQNATGQNGNQADYSAQWAEYYRSIGKIKEAEAIEAQMKNKQQPQQQQGNQMPQSQIQNQPANPAAQSNSFNPAYAGYQTMNSNSAGSNYYNPSAPTTTQPQQGQQNSSFPSGGYQSYQYSQQNSDN